MTSQDDPQVPEGEHTVISLDVYLEPALDSLPSHKLVAVILELNLELELGMPAVGGWECRQRSLACWLAPFEVGEEAHNRAAATPRDRLIVDRQSGRGEGRAAFDGFTREVAFLAEGQVESEWLSVLMGDSMIEMG